MKAAACCGHGFP